MSLFELIMGNVDAVDDFESEKLVVTEQASFEDVAFDVEAFDVEAFDFEEDTEAITTTTGSAKG